MKSDRSPLIDYAIIGLLALNLVVAAYGAFRPQAVATGIDAPAQAQAQAPDIAEAKADHLASDVIERFNARDNAGMYSLFDDLARTQLTREQVDEQMAKLYQVIGRVDDSAYSGAVLAGNDSGRDYYHLNYKVRLSEGPFTTGDMRLTVIRRGDELGLVGMFINGTSKQGQ